LAVNINTAARIYADKDFLEGELHSLATGQVALFSSKCPEKTSPNEDSAAIIPYNSKSVVLVVADGAGGMPSGARASEATVNQLKATIKYAAKNDVSLRAAILDGIEQANKEIVGWGIGAATTVAVAEITENSIRTYHVGDSQILVVGQKGKLKTLTVVG